MKVTSGRRRNCRKQPEHFCSQFHGYVGTQYVRLCDRWNVNKVIRAAEESFRVVNQRTQFIKTAVERYFIQTLKINLRLWMRHRASLLKSAISFFLFFFFDCGRYINEITAILLIRKKNDIITANREGINFRCHHDHLQ